LGHHSLLILSFSLSGFLSFWLSLFLAFSLSGFLSVWLSLCLAFSLSGFLSGFLSSSLFPPQHTGTITPSEITVIEDTCQDKARELYQKSGGNPYDYEKALGDAAVHTMVSTMATCIDTLLKGQSLGLEGVVVGNDGMKTTNKCVAGIDVLTTKTCNCTSMSSADQIPATFEEYSNITAKCNTKSSEAYVVAGGDTGASLASAMTKASENLLETSQDSCFKKYMKVNQKSFQGTCSLDPTLTCDSTSTFSIDTTTGKLTKCGVCTGAANFTEVAAVQSECESTMVKDFFRAGGDVTDLPQAKDTAKVNAMAKKYTAHFDKLEKAAIQRKSIALAAAGRRMVASAVPVTLNAEEYHVIEQASIMKVRSDFMKMGGNSTVPGVDNQVPFYTKVHEGSADFRMKAGVGCFRRQFRRKSYDHTTVTEDQMYDIRHECKNVSQKAFQRAGGNTTQFAGTGLVDMAERRRTQMVNEILNVDATAVPATIRRFFFFIAQLTLQTPPPPPPTPPTPPPPPTTS